MENQDRGSFRGRFNVQVPQSSNFGNFFFQGHGSTLLGYIEVVTLSRLLNACPKNSCTSSSVAAITSGKLVKSKPDFLINVNIGVYRFSAFCC